MGQLDGRKAVVCGASQGIGRASAEALARLGAEVVLVARNPEVLGSVCEALERPSGQTHSWVTADFSRPEEAVGAIEAHLDPDAPVHLLLNNTGGPPGGPVLDAQPEEFIAALTGHVLASHRLARLLVPGMKASGYGRVINIISTSVKQPIPALGVSNTIRGAMANWAKTLAGELAPFGITVNNVLPGATRTQRLEALIRSKSEKTGASEETVAETMKKSIPMGRFAEASEVAAAVAFLAGPEAAYITGINLPVDGGRTACL